MKKIACVVLLLAVCLTTGCSTTQCQVARRTFATAQIGHDAAMLAGHTTQIDRYWWAMGAAAAMVEFWCAAGATEVTP